MPVSAGTRQRTANSEMHTIYRIGFLMDAYETLNLDTETSLLCMDELLHRGHAVYWLEQDDIALDNGRLDARLQKAFPRHRCASTTTRSTSTISTR